jgi:hypothetical protein
VAQLKLIILPEPVPKCCIVHKMKWVELAAKCLPRLELAVEVEPNYRFKHSNSLGRGKGLSHAQSLSFLSDFDYQPKVKSITRAYILVP